MALRAAGSNPVTYPNFYPHANQGSNEPQTREGFSFFEVETNAVNSSEMADFTKYLPAINPGFCSKAFILTERGMLEQGMCFYQDKLRVIEEVFRLVGGIKDENHKQTI